MAAMRDAAAATARRALARQARQSMLAVGVVMLGLLAYAPVAVLVRRVVAVALAHRVPLGETPALMALAILNNVFLEELSSVMMRRPARPLLLLGVVGVQLVLWALVLLAGKHLGVTDFAGAGIPLCMLVYLLGRPIAVLLTPGQRTRARMRRTARELKAGVMRVSLTSIGLTVVLYVYLTVFTPLQPLVEVTVMGFAMPLLQSGCMMLLARLTAGRERAVRRAIEHQAYMSSFSVASKASDGSPGSATADAPTAVVPIAAAPAPADPPLTGAASAADATASTASLRLKPSDSPSKSSSGMAFTVVLSAEMAYSTGAFTVLALAESDGAFFSSLVAMLVVELVQVVVHVKARRVVARKLVSSSSRFEAASTKLTLCDDGHLRRWLLYQELGEKIGALLALGLLALDVTLGRDSQTPALQAVGPEHLVRRGLGILLLQLVGDVAKDLTGQALGLLPPRDEVERVAVSAHVAALTLLMSIGAGLPVQAGIALGR